MKQYLTTKNILGLLIIIILLIALIISLRTRVLVEHAAVEIADIASIRASLSMYMAEVGSYPQASGVGLGSGSAGALCVHTGEGSSGIVRARDMCTGNVLTEFSLGQRPRVYSGGGQTYMLEFVMPHALGAFLESGTYCATERGILPGRCG